VFEVVFLCMYVNNHPSKKPFKNAGPMLGLINN
jgi:hypothetical protein